MERCNGSDVQDWDNNSVQKQCQQSLEGEDAWHNPDCTGQSCKMTSNTVAGQSLCTPASLSLRAKVNIQQMICHSHQALHQDDIYFPADSSVPHESSSNFCTAPHRLNTDAAILVVQANRDCCILQIACFCVCPKDL